MPFASDLRAAALGRPLHDRTRYCPFFIVGSGRCGTTLLRTILQSHPDVHIPPETYVVGSVVREYRLFSRLPWTTLLRVVLGRFEYHRQFFTLNISLRDLYRDLLNAPEENRNLAYVVHRIFMYHAEKNKPSAVRWGDKTPLHVYSLPDIRRLYPDVHVVNLIRDGRDVVQSFVKTGLIGSYQEAAARWLSSVKAAEAFTRRYPNQISNIRYEQLATQPEVVVDSICTAIGLTFRPEMLVSRPEGSTLGDVAIFTHHARATRPVRSDRIGAWKHTLSTGDQKILMRQLGPKLEALGYED